MSFLRLVPPQTVVVPARAVFRVPRVDRSRRMRVRFPRTKAAGYGQPAPTAPFPSSEEEAMFTPASSSYTHRHYRPTQLPVEQDTTDLPLDDCSHNPYQKEPRKCLLCAHPEIKVDYKNPRLLSQFISNFSGRTFDHHITGLCKEQQMRVLRAIKLSRTLGYMGIVVKNPQYLADPPLFDPMKNVKPNTI